MGLTTPNDKHQFAIKYYIEEMFAISIADRLRTKPFARWKEEYIINWGTR